MTMIDRNTVFGLYLHWGVCQTVSWSRPMASWWWWWSLLWQEIFLLMVAEGRRCHLRADHWCWVVHQCWLVWLAAVQIGQVVLRLDPALPSHWAGESSGGGVSPFSKESVVESRPSSTLYCFGLTILWVRCLLFFWPTTGVSFSCWQRVPASYTAPPSSWRAQSSSPRNFRIHLHSVAEDEKHIWRE